MANDVGIPVKGDVVTLDGEAWTVSRIMDCYPGQKRRVTIWRWFQASERVKQVRSVELAKLLT